MPGWRTVRDTPAGEVAGRGLRAGTPWTIWRHVCSLCSFLGESQEPFGKTGCPADTYMCDFVPQCHTMTYHDPNRVNNTFR